MDLIQVHNLADVPTQLGILKEQKQEGNVRYIGVTTTSDSRHGDLSGGGHLASVRPAPDRLPPRTDRW